jgi:hypothetical protein
MFFAKKSAAYLFVLKNSSSAEAAAFCAKSFVHHSGYCWAEDDDSDCIMTTAVYCNHFDR